jgi:hypothetical protein
MQFKPLQIYVTNSAGEQAIEAQLVKLGSTYISAK